MKSVLVTGATGFVGSHALEALNNKSDIKVIAACRNRGRLMPTFKGDVRVGDVRDSKYILSLFDNVDVLVNASAWTSAWGHEKESHEHFYLSALRLLDKAIEKGVKIIINISSVSVAAPEASSDPMSDGIIRRRWPHLDNVVRIENFLRTKAGKELTVINLRLGTFVGKRYGLGILPILLPRLKTHLVPWVAGGWTSAPLIDGRDIGQAIALAVTNDVLTGYESFNIVGPEVPTVRELIEFLHDEYGYPKPHFNVPFFIAYPFARLMEWLDPVVPWEPLVTRSIVHLLEEVHADNSRAELKLGYQPQYHWKDSVHMQIEEMKRRQQRPMRLARPIS